MFCTQCGMNLPDDSKFCVKCGASLSEEVGNEQGSSNQQTVMVQQNIVPRQREAVVSQQVILRKEKGVFSAGRLTIGIISMVLFVFVMFQSCAAGVVNSLEGNGATSGSNGVVFSFLILIAGIVGVCTRNSLSKAGAFITTGFYWFASLMTIGTGETFGDLPIWGGLSFIFGIVFLIAGIKTKKQ